MDEARMREIGYRDLCLPSFGLMGRLLPWPRQAPCPDCGGVTGVRVCPCCHSTVPSTFGSSSSRLITIVGPSGSGKTVYLQTLHREVREVAPTWFGADVEFGTRDRRPVRRGQPQADEDRRDH